MLREALSVESVQFHNNCAKLLNIKKNMNVKKIDGVKNKMGE